MRSKKFRGMPGFGRSSKEVPHGDPLARIADAGPPRRIAVTVAPNQRVSRMMSGKSIGDGYLGR